MIDQIQKKMRMKKILLMQLKKGNVSLNINKKLNKRGSEKKKKKKKEF